MSQKLKLTDEKFISPNKKKKNYKKTAHSYSQGNSKWQDKIHGLLARYADEIASLHLALMLAMNEINWHWYQTVKQITYKW